MERLKNPYHSASISPRLPHPRNLKVDINLGAEFDIFYFRGYLGWIINDHLLMLREGDRLYLPHIIPMFSHDWEHPEALIKREGIHMFLLGIGDTALIPGSDDYPPSKLTAKLGSYGFARWRSLDSEFSYINPNILSISYGGNNLLSKGDLVVKYGYINILVLLRIRERLDLSKIHFINLIDSNDDFYLVDISNFKVTSLKLNSFYAFNKSSNFVPVYSHLSPDYLFLEFFSRK